MITVIEFTNKRWEAEIIGPNEKIGKEAKVWYHFMLSGFLLG